MARARALAAVLVALLAGLLSGYGLAGAAHTPPNDACGNFGNLPEGSSSSSAIDLWPLAVSCEYYGTAGERRSESFGPSRHESLVWMAMAALFALVALRARRSAPARGAAAATALLGLVSVAWAYNGVFGALWVAAVFGAPLVFTIDLVLRSDGRRSWQASAVTALALVPAVVVAFVFLELGSQPYVGIATGVLAGGAIAAAVTRLGSPRGDLQPSH